jgi:hypothetical protein
VGRAVTLDIAPELRGYVKVRLRFKTWDPQHVRSHALKNEFNAEPPYIEDVSVLVPVSEAYNRLSAYKDIFSLLQAGGVVAKTDQLTEFEIREEDTLTLAYYELRD